ncbi:Low-density lipoprotein receptor-related protein 8 [Oryzias melastigma]|uniref:Low-density lipoprotein receptor-related protein 8 n=1 Tax=Oryzias melastigma TaxID=30732 RepID=A0A834FHY4_ORYME|nr:Low-density lipoprotein receptor-related protein 8 [Oryzias melastigma]
MCDGRADCTSKRDESLELCGSDQPVAQTAPTCAPSEFRCGDGECIRHVWRCDNTPDCSDGSDEEDCNQNECLVNNGGCSHRCVDLPMGFLCQCPDHMKLVDDSRCEEVDVCLERDVCDQLCVYSSRSITCDCHEGYRPGSTTGECTAEGDEAQLVFTTSKGVQLMSLFGADHETLAPHLPGRGPVAAVTSNRTLYWAKQGQNFIYRISVDKEPQEATLVQKVQGSVSGLAVDWIHRLLYWTSPDQGSVNVALMDGSSEHPLITGLDEPSAVAVDPLQGFVFWTQCGSAPKIERAGLDGRRRTALVTSSLNQPVAITLDIPRQLLYWFDQRTRSISRVTYEGRHRKTVVESNGYLDRVFGLAVFEGFLYWSDEVTRSICRANKHDGKNLQVLLSDIPSAGGVAIIQPVLQPNGPAMCGRPGTACPHTCLVDLQPERIRFSCVSPETRSNKPQTPEISNIVPAATFSVLTFAGILSLIIFLSVLLLGGVLWWWRRLRLQPSRTSSALSFSLKDSQDPLISQESHSRTRTFLIEDLLLKVDLDSD